VAPNPLVLHLAGSQVKAVVKEPLLLDLAPPIRTIVLETSKTHYAPDRVLYARGREVERQPGMTSNYTVEGRMFLGHAIALEAWINSEGHDP
jgi:hypothetical protein